MARAVQTIQLLVAAVVLLAAAGCSGQTRTRPPVIQLEPQNKRMSGSSSVHEMAATRLLVTAAAAHRRRSVLPAASTLLQLCPPALWSLCPPPVTAPPMAPLAASPWADARAAGPTWPAKQATRGARGRCLGSTMIPPPTASCAMRVGVVCTCSHTHILIIIVCPDCPLRPLAAAASFVTL